MSHSTCPLCNEVNIIGLNCDIELVEAVQHENGLVEIFVKSHPNFDKMTRQNLKEVEDWSARR